MNHAVKIFTSCALGAGIGTLIALQLNHYFWWTGMLVGGFVGYISYEFNKVISAVPLAWQYVVVNKPKWKPLWLGFWAATKGLCYFLLLILQWILMFMFFGSDKIIALFPFVAMPIAISPALMGIFILLFFRGTPLKLKNFREALVNLNVFSVFCYYLPVGLWFGGKWTINKIPVFTPTIRRFFRYLFLLIHSEVRLLCGVDAAIGACVGYFSGNAIVGALAGGLFGVLNYEIISKRILKIAPANSNK